MKKLLRLLFRLSFFLLIILLGFVLLNFLRFSSRQIEVSSIEEIKVDDSVVNRLSEAIRFPTISYTDRVDTLAFQQFGHFLDSMFYVVNQELELTKVSQFSRIYHWPGKNPKLKPILLMAHMDVVPIEKSTASQWQEAPFGGTIKDGFVWGRGALDDKNNVLGILESVQLLLKQGYQPDRTLYFVFGHDEEVSGINGASAIAQRLTQQKIAFEYIMDEGMLVLENALPGLDAPVSLIGIAEKGYTTLTLHVELENGGHSSMPLTESAIGILSGAIHRLEKKPFPAKLNGIVGELFDYVGPEMDPMYKTIFANRWLFGGILKSQLSAKASTNATIRTTTAPTVVKAGVKENVLPAVATAQINFRILPGETVTSVIDYVKEVIEDDRVIVTEFNEAASTDPTKVSDTDSFGFTVLQKTSREIFPDAAVAPALMIAATDSRHFQNLSDNIFRYSPVQLQNADLARIHGFNERISIENYKRLIRFYSRLIRNSCN